MNQERQFHFLINRGSPSDRSVDCHSPLFRLHAPPSTDLWRKPPVESFNIPCSTTCILTEEFVSARVTVSGAWTRLYDQAGFVLVWYPEGRGPTSDEPPASWIKTGIEFYNERPNLSTVATPATSSSDWSLIPLDNGTVTIEIERETKSGVAGSSLWVYLLENGDRKAVREVTWAFSEEKLLENLHIGLYVARPTKLDNTEDNEELVAQFTDFKLVASDGAKNK